LTICSPTTGFPAWSSTRLALSPVSTTLESLTMKSEPAGYTIRYPLRSNNEAQQESFPFSIEKATSGYVCPRDCVTVAIVQVKLENRESELNFWSGLHQVGRLIGGMPNLKGLIFEHTPYDENSWRLGFLNFDVDLRCEAILLHHARQIAHLKLPAPYVGDMSYDHVETFAEALAHHPCLEKITMCPETARVLSEYHAYRDLQTAILSLPRLREVDYPEFFQADLLSKLVVKPSMESLCVNERYLTEEQRMNLCAALGSPESQVCTLDLIEVRVVVPTETEAATETRNEEVKTQWSEVFSTNRSLTKIFLDLFSEPKSADLIGQTLGHHPALRELVLSVGGEQHSQVLAFLAASKTLFKLTLNNFCGTVSTITALRQVLVQNRLISLSIDGTLDNQAWHMLAPALASCISLKSLSLKSDVVLGYSGMGSDILSVLGSSINSNWKSLKDLKVSFPFINCPLSAVTSFLFSLNENSKLSSLQLDFQTRESWPANLIYAVMSNFGLTHFGGTCLDFDRHHFFTNWLKSLVEGVLVMNRSGRRYLLDDPHDKAKGVKVLAAVYYNLDCIFLHLVENPFLCYRDEP